MVSAKTKIAISLGDTKVTHTELASIMDALTKQYNVSHLTRTGASVSVTLYQELDVAMSLTSDMSDAQLCEALVHVLMRVVLVQAFDLACSATSSSVGKVFHLAYPLVGNVTAVNARTAQMQASRPAPLTLPPPPIHPTHPATPPF